MAGYHDVGGSKVSVSLRSSGTANKADLDASESSNVELMRPVTEPVYVMGWRIPQLIEYTVLTRTVR